MQIKGGFEPHLKQMAHPHARRLYERRRVFLSIPEAPRRETSGPAWQRFLGALPDQKDIKSAVIFTKNKIEYI